MCIKSSPAGEEKHTLLLERRRARDEAGKVKGL